MPLTTDDTSVLIQLNGKIETLIHGINSVKDKQDEMADDIVKIKEAVYNPDEGLYARLRDGSMERVPQSLFGSSLQQWLVYQQPVSGI